MIAILIHYVERTEGGYEHQLRQSFVATCKKQDFDCTIICGGSLDDPSPDIFFGNELYGLVDAQNFDAAILISSGLCTSRSKS